MVPLVEKSKPHALSAYIAACSKMGDRHKLVLDGLQAVERVLDRYQA